MLIKAFTAITNKYQMIKIDDLIVHLTILLTYDQSLLLTQITSFASMLVFEWVMGWTPRGKPCSS